MTRHLVIRVGFGVLAAIVSAGCESQPAGHESPYAGGNGAFGEGTEQPAAYHARSSGEAPAQEPGFAGGNGAFGESPAQAGEH